MGWVERGGIFQLLEVILVSGVVTVHLERPDLPALRAILPPAFMALLMMSAADGVHRVIAKTTIARIRERHVLVRVIANPIPATRRAGELLPLAAKSAPRRSAGNRMRLVCRVFFVAHRSCHIFFLTLLTRPAK